MSNDVVRILSIDGGGIRGIIPAMVVKELLGVLKAQDVFHIITGTSTGGIIACGLAKPTPIDVNDIIDLYVKHGSEIFKNGILSKFHFLHGAEYQPNSLENYLAAEFSQVWLSDVQNVELLVPSYAIGLPDDTQSLPMFFRSWQARGQSLGGGATKEEYDFQLQSVCRATSAAPTYFPPAVIKNRAAQSFTMIDGGVFANNPTLCAIVEAHRL
jgi:patatin-like phospholipase/acyl hydrolase